MKHLIDVGADPDVVRWQHLLALLRREVDALEVALPGAIDAQWERSPVPRPREDTHERASGGISDPTADVAADEARVILRAQLVRSERIARSTIVAVRGVRRGLEMALARWEGDEA